MQRELKRRNGFGKVENGKRVDEEDEEQRKLESQVMKVTCSDTLEANNECK